MRWWRRRRPVNPEPPRGVILLYRGRAITCSVFRDESLDRWGTTAWVAMPDEPVVIPEGEEYRVRADDLPVGCELITDFTAPRDVSADW